jgi:hypothetical protein
MTTERLTISFDPERGQLRITDGRMMRSLGVLVPVMTMSGPADKREELVARFNAARGNWGLPPLPDPDLPTNPPVSDVPISSSSETDPLASKPLRKPPPPERPASVPDSPTPAAAAGTVWEQYENRHDDYPWRERNDAVLSDKWWTYRIAARHDEKEIKGSGKTYGRLAAKFLRENYKEHSPYPEGARKIRIIADYAHDKHTTSGQRMGRGVEHFFDDGGVLVNCTLLDPYLDRAREICIAKEKREQRERWLKADERRDRWR